ncbi:Predicted protein [Raineyella antarctica]|uniref:Phosphodiester glycosidase domain-containing protein n=1 Tax=Raineyella antarctica TaxID=1577474 RepID=A0A1G6HER2_9ACTN|nr:phosphodiester glycosidase family protein [Raineyella antarctica]SDB92643.1 Predicted protein [Raineyella antarctica]
MPGFTTSATSGRPRRAVATAPRLRRRWLAVPALLVASVVLWTAVSLGQALDAPGTDSTAARIAEWGRDHHMSGLITLLEQWQYKLNPPKTGGAPTQGDLQVGAAGAVRTETRRPAAVPSQAGPALPGEGQWRPLYSYQGHTAALVTSLRPDGVHTSYVVHAVWLDPRLNSFVLHPGSKEPGPVAHESSQLTGKAASTVLASFNSGFKMDDAQGGYWQDGHAVAPLRAGAASMVLGNDGSLKVESWPGGQPGAGVAAVRQNLTLLVDKGKVAPAVSDPSSKVWGKTVGNASAVWRSGVGTRADGSTVVVLGPSLTVTALAQILRDTGAVEAMQLDINKDWTSFITYTHDHSGTTPTKLTSDEFAAANRYLQPSSRDFVAVMPHGES